MADTDKTTLPKNPSQEIGQSGTLIQHGYITNEDYNRNLSGRAGIEQYEIMRRSDSTVRSMLQMVKQPILSAKFDMQAAQDKDGKVSDDDDYKMRFVKRELFESIDFHSHLKQALTHFDFGYSVFEKVFDMTEFEGKTRIGIKKLASRKQSTIARWCTEDDQPGITQMTGVKTFSIPREKLMIYTYEKEGDNYEGISLLRHIYKDWDIKDKLVIVNAIALERQGVGVPIVQAKPGETLNAQDEDKAIEALSNLRANEKAYLKIPASMEVTMMDMKGSTTKEIIPSLNYHDGRIMTGGLARFMELGGASGSGSQALSSDLSSIFMKAEEAVANELIATITEDLIKQLCDLNFSDMSNGYPKLTCSDIADDDTTSLATNVASLIQAGAITADIELEENLRRRHNLPEMSEEAKASYGHTEDVTDTTKETKETAITTKETKTLDNDEDVKAALDEAVIYRSKLLASLVA